MTSTEKKELLNRYKYLEAMLDEHIEELYRWRAKSEKIVPDSELYPEGNNYVSSVVFAVENILEIEKTINAEIEVLKNLRIKIVNAINKMTDPTLKLITELKYIKCLTLEEIAERLNYSWRQTERLHIKAIDLIEF